MYLDFLVPQHKITFTRHAFDSCLRSLAVTQHHLIWPRYLEFVKSYQGIPDTALRVYRRHLQLDPEASEDYVEYLLSIGRVDAAAVKLADMVASDSFRSKRNKTQHDVSAVTMQDRKARKATAKGRLLFASLPQPSCFTLFSCFSIVHFDGISCGWTFVH